jgi:hypothetical protein
MNGAQALLAYWPGHYEKDLGATHVDDDLRQTFQMLSAVSAYIAAASLTA